MAENALNAIMLLENRIESRELKWTKELPIKEGWYWYWFRNEVGSKEIVHFKNGYFESYCIDGSLSVDELPDGEWYGPIEPPGYP